jgi:hypothetical protein
MIGELNRAKIKLPANIPIFRSVFGTVNHLTTPCCFWTKGRCIKVRPFEGARQVASPWRIAREAARRARTSSAKVRYLESL